MVCTGGEAEWGDAAESELRDILGRQGRSGDASTPPLPVVNGSPPGSPHLPAAAADPSAAGHQGRTWPSPPGPRTQHGGLKPQSGPAESATLGKYSQTCTGGDSASSVGSCRAECRCQGPGFSHRLPIQTNSWRIRFTFWYHSRVPKTLITDFMYIHSRARDEFLVRCCSRETNNFHTRNENACTNIEPHILDVIKSVLD